MIMGYVVNRAQVIAELFDDEVVIINLDRGSYYSLDQAGLLIWRAIEAAADKPTIEGLLAERYSAEPGQIDDGLRQLFDELCAEALIIPGQTSSLSTTLTASAAERQSFVAPHLQIYTDMQDLLRLDPIHDVDETGWPYARQP